MAYGEISDPQSTIPATSRLRMEEAIAEIRAKVGIEVSVGINHPFSGTNQGSTIGIECLNEKEKCELKVFNLRVSKLDAQDFADIEDVSRRSFRQFGVAVAAERSVFVLNKRLLSFSPPPWRRSSLRDLFFDE